MCKKTRISADKITFPVVEIVLEVKLFSMAYIDIIILKLELGAVCFYLKFWKAVVRNSKIPNRHLQQMFNNGRPC